MVLAAAAFSSPLLRGTACAALLAVVGLLGCQPNLNVGEWTCSEDGSVKTPPAATAPVALEWSTGFENRFCDYTELAGFCYASDAASYELVTAPVHHGRFAAAFKLTGEESSDAHTRCVRQGVLPAEAYYGAWYYVPSAPTKAVNWNLFHFRGGSAVTSTDGFLDVSLVNSNGSLRLAVYGRDYHPIGDAADSPPFRTERWIHVQLFLKLRQGTNGGEVALYQDGNVVLDVAELSTNDSTYGQWYLGNLGSGLTPPDSTLYVDDVTISASL